MIRVIISCQSICLLRSARSANGGLISVGQNTIARLLAFILFTSCSCTILLMIIVVTMVTVSIATRGRGGVVTNTITLYCIVSVIDGV